MTINQTDTVRDVTIAMPEATGIFEKLGIDYCCGGNRTLAEASRLAKVPIEEVMGLLAGTAQIEQGKTLTDWQPESLTALTTFIVDQHHQFTRNELTRLPPIMKKVCAVHGANHPELLRLQELFHHLNEDLTTHLLKEEQVLFPWIGKMEEALNSGKPVPPPFFKTVRNPVRTMMAEHETVGDLLREMRQVTTDYCVPSDGCFSFQTLYQGLAALESDLHQHIHLENNLLFPRAIEMETSAEPEAQNFADSGCEHHCFSQ